MLLLASVGQVMVSLRALSRACIIRQRFYSLTVSFNREYFLVVSLHMFFFATRLGICFWVES